MQTKTTETTNADSAETLFIAEYTAKRSREGLIQACRQAVECLERFANDARREVDRAAELDPQHLVGLVGTLLSQSAWGLANASSELSTANQRAAEYMKALGALEVLK